MKTFRLRVLLAIMTVLLVGTGSYLLLVVRVFVTDRAKYSYDLVATAARAKADESYAVLDAYREKLEDVARRRDVADVSLPTGMVAVEVWQTEPSPRLVYRAINDQTTIAELSGDDLAALEASRALPSSTLAQRELSVFNASLPPDLALLGMAVGRLEGGAVVVGYFDARRLLRVLSSSPLYEVAIVDEAGGVLAASALDEMIAHERVPTARIPRAGGELTPAVVVRELETPAGMVLGAEVPLGLGGARALVWLNVRDAYAVSRRMTRLAVYVAFGVLFGGLLAGLWLSSRLAGPLEEIERATRQIAEGNFGVDLRRIPDGELASLYRAVDDMGRRLAERERQIRESAAEVERNERLTQIGSLAAGVAHEINNPLTFISASQEVVRDALTLAHEVAHTTDAQERARQLEALEAALARGHNALDDMNHGINRVTRIVRDLGQLSRSPASDDIHPLDLRWPIEKALEMARHHIESRARVVLDLDPGLVVKADAGRLEQVFVNLFVNAAHAMKEHAAATNILRIAAHRRRAAVVVEITDSGKGIAAEHVSKIFMPFFSTKRAGEGSGIGLAMCKRILESFDGSIELLYADPGRTTFRVSLPACDEAVQPAPRPASERLVLASSEPRRRVLAVDDEPTLLAAVQRSLCQQHDVVTVGSAEEALRLLRADDGFDLVLCDITIPGMSGVELFQRVKEVLPVVAARFMFMTGGILDDSVQRFLAEVPNRALCKPFTPVELRQAVGDALAATRRWSPSSADERNNQGHA